MTALSEKHRRFVAAFVRDDNAATAAIAAGYSPRSAAATGGRLLTQPEIRAEIDRVRAEAARPIDAPATPAITRAALLREAELARAMAQESGSASAAVAAVALKARLLGWLDDPADDAAADLTREAAVTRSAATAGKLLIDAAVSLGLPPTASPAMIVGAIAGREIATPQCFALLRAGMIANEGNDA